MYDKYLHTLGNLSLSGYNSELSDKNFNEKVKMIKDVSKFNVLNQDVINKQTWNREAIISRAERLSNILLKELKLPEIFNTKNINNENAHHVYDNFDYSNKKPISFTFLGENREVSSIRDMMIKFVELLYSYDSEKIQYLATMKWRSSNAKLPFICFDEALLTSGKEIANTGIYIETNKSFNDTVSYIGYLLKELDIDADDFVFYVKNNE